MTEQYPVDRERLDGFGVIGLWAVDASLADVQLPAAEVGWVWVHRFSM